MPISPRTQRPRFAGKALLRVGDTPAASVESYSGGEAFAEVVDEPGGLLPYAKKHIGELRFADLEAQVAMDAHPALFRWIRDAWFGNPARDRVALDALDSGSTESRSLELSHARIREVVLPALDAVSRDKRCLSLRIAPRGVRRIKRPMPLADFDRRERDFLAHNFSVEIDGLDCKGVLAVDSLSVQTRFPEGGSGRRGLLVFPHIHLHVEEQRADPFEEWFEDFIIRGNNDDDKERTGTITYFDPFLTDPLAVLQLHHLGIFCIADEPPAGTGPRQVRVDLYCERMELSPVGGNSGETDEVPPVRP
jgi:hypothetical protein